VTADIGKRGRRFLHQMYESRVIQLPKFFTQGGTNFGTIIRAGVGFFALALVAAGCAEDRRFATAGATKDTGKLVVPARITPPVTVARIEGAPESWQFNTRVAKALRDRDVPAGTKGRGKASYTLKGRAETLKPAPGGATRLRIVWSLYDASGKRVGQAVQTAALPAGSAPDAPTLDRAARSAAARLSPLVPHTAVKRGGPAGRPDPIWRRIVGAPVTAIGKQDARRGAGGLAGRFLALRHVNTVPATDRAQTPEARIAAKRRAAAARVPQQTAKAGPQPVIKPERPAASGTAVTRRTVVTERIARVAQVAQVAKTPSARLAAGKRIAARPLGVTAVSRAVRKDAAIRPAPHSNKFPATAGGRRAGRPVQIAEAVRGRKKARRRAARGARVIQETEGYWVQLASNPNAKASHAAWTALVAAHGPLLTRQPHAVNRADLGRKGIYYRLQLGPYPNIAQARRVCASLRAARVTCFLVTPTGQVALRTPAKRRTTNRPRINAAPRAPKPRAPKVKAPAPKVKAPAPRVKAPAPKPKARAPEAKTPKAPKAKAAAPKAKPATPKAKRAAPTAGKSAHRKRNGGAAGKAAAVKPAAGKAGAVDPRARWRARPGVKPGLGARVEKPKSRAEKLPFQRSKTLPGLTD
jgi:hypothetical protein